MHMELVKNPDPGQKELTTDECGHDLSKECPAGDVLKLLSGKWKPEILRLACHGLIRFNSLLRKIPGSNKQSLSVALRELEEGNILFKKVISEKPLHIEYSLTERGKLLMPIFTIAATALKSA
jgi:DNA-binding HxlR family transcriptional regulator